MKKKIKLLIIQLLLFGMIVFFVFSYVLIPVHIKGRSMENTIVNNSYALINALDYSVDHIERFDIIALHSDKLDEDMIKRVIGLPNDHVEYKDDILYINGIRVNEDFLDKNFVNFMKDTYQSELFTLNFKIQLNDDEYFVLGDNRIESVDSRVLGVFHKSDIIGVNGMIFYPFENILFLN